MIENMRILIISLFFIMIYLPLTKGQKKDMKFRHITVTNGLTQSTVNAVCQDFRGYMWFGTADGLNKYNGFNIEKFYYAPGDTASLPSSDITCIYENPYDSILYIGTKAAGIAVYDRNNNSFLSVNRLLQAHQSRKISNVVSITSEGKNGVWIISNGQGVFRFNINGYKLYSPRFNNEKIFRTTRCIVFDNENNMWLGTSRGLYRWDTQVENSYPVKTDMKVSENGMDITKLRIDVKGRLYIGTKNEGLFRYNPHDGSLVSVFIRKNRYTGKILSINDVIIPQENEIWIATNFGLYKIEDNTVRSFFNDPDDQHSINDNHILSLFKSRSGIIWTGTLLGGVNKFDPRTTLFPKYNDFFTRDDRNGEYYPYYNNIYGIETDEDDNVWINTSGGLLEIKASYFNTGKANGNVIRHSEKQLSGDFYIDKRLGVFYTDNDKLFLRASNGRKEDLTAVIKQQTGKEISAFTSGYTDSDGVVWFSTIGGVLKYYPEKKEFELMNLNIGNNNTAIQINEIRENRRGKLLLATNNAMLIEFDKYSGQSTIIFPFADNSHEKNTFTKVFTVLEYEPGKLYIGTNSGLYFIDTDKKEYKHFVKINGELFNVVYGLLKDDNGKLWCTTNNGLVVYSPGNRSFQHFTYYEGLQSNEFNQSAYYKDGNGIFYVGGIDGMNIFDPDDIYPDNNIPPVLLEKFEILYDDVTPATHPEILKKQISETSSIRLSFKQSTFSFEYIALCYSQPDRINYKYKLEGFDNKWVEAGKRRSATYTNVPPGRYTFKVLNTNTNGIWRKDPLSVEIEIPAPFWQMIWFWLLILFLVIAGGSLYFFFKIRNIKKQKLHLTYTINEKTDELYRQKLKIEQQNAELISRNQIITQKNIDLNKQHVQIKQQHDELVKLAQKLKETNRAKLQFFTAVSHEFRTPLTLIISPLKDIIENTDRFNKVQLIRHLSTVYSNASKLLLLIDQLLDFRKVESGKEKLTLSKVEIVSFTGKILALFNDLALKNSIKTGLRSSAPLIVITADILKLEKIITNLISNAFKNTPKNGEILINIDQSESEKGIKYVRVTVADSGYGIDSKDVDKIFEHFYRGEKEQAYGGSGLGLVLVKRYVELHEGEIRVESVLGEGTKFIFTIPVGKHISDVAPDEKYIEPMGENYRQVIAGLQSYFPVNLNRVETSDERKKQTILLIDNDEDLRGYLYDALSVHFRIITCDNAEKGFQIAASKDPDLIITDVALKRMDGIKFCSKIRSHFNTSHIPIIILSALTEHENVVKGLSAGANDYITKPFELEYLVLKINNLLYLKEKLQSKIIHDTQLTDHEFSDKKDKQFIDKVVECVEANISDSTYSVDQLCDCVGISHPQVYRKIKALTNMSISVFIRNIRLKKAAKLLLSKDIKINEVAYEVGFSDPNYFTKCFTKLYEQTPREYVKNARG